VGFFVPAKTLSGHPIKVCVLFPVKAWISKQQLDLTVKLDVLLCSSLENIYSWQITIIFSRLKSREKGFIDFCRETNVVGQSLREANGLFLSSGIKG
jgi:hypothetical protein